MQIVEKGSWDPALTEAVGVILQMWRLDVGLTGTALARKMGTSKGAIRKFERGDHTQTLAIVYRFAEATHGDVRQVLAVIDLWYGLEAA